MPIYDVLEIPVIEDINPGSDLNWSPEDPHNIKESPSNKCSTFKVQC